MAKYLNSSMSFIVNGLTYEPWVRPKVRSDSTIRLKNRRQPPGLKTCWELNTFDATNPNWSLCLPPCGACLVFHQDKDHFVHLRSLASNHGAPYQYRCNTLWKGSVAATSKGLPPVSSGVSEIPTTPPPHPETTKETSEGISRPDHPRSHQGGPATDVTTPSVVSEQGETLTAYLVCRLDLQEQLVGTLTADKKDLEERNDFFNASTADLKKLAEEINVKYESSEREVTYLRRLMESKVDALMIELATEKACTATAKAKTASKTTQVSVLAGRTDELLHELLVEKSLVVKLCSDLEDYKRNKQTISPCQRSLMTSRAVLSAFWIV
jgi:hypothetical protein